jgi:elongation factor G
MDREGADFEAACKSISHRLGVVTLPLQMPIIKDETVCGSVDLLTMDCQYWRGRQAGSGSGGGGKGSSGGKGKGVDPSEMVDVVSLDSCEDPSLQTEAAAARQTLLDTLADHDDEFCEAMLMGMEEEAEEEDWQPPVEQVVAALRRVVGRRVPPPAGGGGGGGQDSEDSAAAAAAEVVVPVLLGASLRGFGVEPLLDAIPALLPAPTDRPKPCLEMPAAAGGKGGSSGGKEVATSVSDPLCALAFKVANDQHRGALVYLRVFGGSLTKGQLISATNGRAWGTNTTTNTTDTTTDDGSSDSSSDSNGSGSDGGGGNGMLAAAGGGSSGGGGNSGGGSSGGGGGGQKERVLHVFRPFADDFVPLKDGEGAGPGETVVCVGLKHVKTGDTVVAFKGPLHGAALPGIPVPQPVRGVLCVLWSCARLSHCLRKPQKKKLCNLNLLSTKITTTTTTKTNKM